MKCYAYAKLEFQNFEWRYMLIFVHAYLLNKYGNSKKYSINHADFQLSFTIFHISIT